MKKRINSILFLILLVLAIGGGALPLNAEKLNGKSTFIQISEKDFYLMDKGWLNEMAHDYETDPYWCFSQDVYDTIYLKYKLNARVKEHFLRSVQSVSCTLYDGVIQINSRSETNSATYVPREPRDVMTLNFAGLNLRKDHNLHACCRLQYYNPDTRLLETISNEVCFSKEIPRVKCASYKA